MANLLVVVVLCWLMAGAAMGQEQVAALQASLDGALQDDPPIVLVVGTDFSAEPGTVIFLSRDAGMRRMVALARSGEPELSMLFLPRWEAWITETKVRMPDETRIDTRYIAAALAREVEVELWHTHNDIGEELVDAEERRKRSLRWAMPSAEDFLQLCEFARDIPNAGARGVVAGIYGVTEYWNDDPQWAQPLYVRFALRNEAEQLNHRVGDESIAGLQKFAGAHRGVMRLRFTPVPGA